MGYPEKPPDGSAPSGADQALSVKLWVGVGAIVVSVAAPGVNPADLQCIASGTCLQVRGAGPEGPILHEIDLPYPVHDQPIAINKGGEENALYLLLKKTL